MLFESLTGATGLVGLIAPASVLLATGEPNVGIGTDNIYIQVSILVFSVLMVAFFSSAEASLISVNKFRIRYLSEQGNRSAQAVNRVLSRHEKFFATILLTENAFIIFASSVGAVMAIRLLSGFPSPELLSALIMTVFIVIFGEITPKTLAARSSDRWSLIIARPIELVMLAETFVIFLFTLVPRLIMRLTRDSNHALGPSVTEGELRMLIDISRAEGAVGAREAFLLEKVFKFGDQQVQDVMTPRTAIVWVEQGTSLDSFLKIYTEYSHTRFPVYEGTTENVVGVLSNKDVLLAMGRGQLQPQDSVTGLLREAYFVPETKTISDAFSEMQQGGYGLMLTVDEFGGIAGLCTMKQLLEVIVGEVGGEGNLPEDAYTALGDNSYKVSAAVTIEEINEKLDLAIPEGDYQTVAGFILDQIGYIPEAGEVLEYRNMKLTIKQMNGVRIDTVELEKLQKVVEEEEAK